MIFKFRVCEYNFLLLVIIDFFNDFLKVYYCNLFFIDKLKISKLI